MSSAGPLYILELTPETAALWFVLAPLPGDMLDWALAYTAEVLAAGPLEPALLMVGFEGEEVVGRFQATLDHAGRLRVWAPQFREDLDETARRWFSGAFLDACFAQAEARSEYLYGDAELSMASPSPDWREMLIQRDFKPVASYHLYERPLDGLAPDGEAGAALEWKPVDSISESIMLGLLTAMREDSQDRIHRLAPENAATHLQRLRTQPLLTPDYSTWWVAFEAERPVGLIFTSLEAETLGSPERGWILEIGVVPSARGRGFAKILLRRGLQDLAGRGARTARARIDDHNQPSIQLHRQAGFVASPDGFEVWWRPRPFGLGRHHTSKS